jgi:predicted ATPase/DNA-binding SARP family transcriptional activator
VEFRILGPVEARSDGGRIDLGRPKQRALLAALLLRSGTAVPRDALVDALWGEEPPASAVQSLQVYVHGLRKALGTERIETRGTSYRIVLQPGELDLERFQALVARAARDLDAGRPDSAAGSLRAALALWQGPALADLAAEPLASAERERLEEERLRALELLGDAELECGHHDAVLGELDALVAEHPYRESFRRQQVLALYRAGRQKEALEAYGAARATLDELGIEPSAELRELELAILRQDPGLAGPERPEELETHLPRAPTALVGRQLEIAAVAALLRDQTRLVTLTGPGGTGKTRLALAVAEELSAELPARFVDLSPLRDPGLLPATVEHELDIQDGERPAAAAIAERLGERRLLLILDNFEQLLEGAPFVAELLAAAPTVSVLATSRASLRLSAEHEYPVPPLPQREAVELFAARARAVDPGFALTEERSGSVAEICRRLDGLPLALELAAARSKLLPPEAMVGRLERSLELLTAGARDLPARQQTLQATLDWSYELLEPAARELLARLAVFRGGCTIEAAEAVVPGPDVLGLMESLVDESLLRRVDGGSGPRFAMLETIREYATARLEASGAEEDAQRRHAAYFLRLAETAAGDLAVGTVDDETLAELDAEHDNLRAALAWAATAGEIEGEVRMAVALRQYWLVRGELTEARRAFEGAIARSASAEPRLHAIALVNGGAFPYRQGDIDEAKRLWTRAHELYVELGDEGESGRCLAELASIAVAERDFERAAALYQESVKHFEAQGQPVRQAIALANLGAIAGMRGDLDASAAYHEEAIPIQRELGDRDGLAITLHNLARTEIKRGRSAEAEKLLAEALELGIALGYRELIANCLQGCAELAAVAGDLERAARLSGTSLAIFDEIGVPLAGETEDDYLALRATLVEGLGDERVDELEAEGRAAPRDETVVAALRVLGVRGSDPEGV